MSPIEHERYMVDRWHLQFEKRGSAEVVNEGHDRTLIKWTMLGDQYISDAELKQLRDTFSEILAMRERGK